MIDKKDVKTVDAFPVKKRGRPLTGNALTPGERKASQRRRDWLSLHTNPDGVDLKLVTVTALLEGLSSAVSKRHFSSASAYAKELVRRSKLPI